MSISIRSIPQQIGINVLQTEHARHNLKNASLKQSTSISQMEIQQTGTGQAVQGPADLGANLDVFA